MNAAAATTTAKANAPSSAADTRQRMLHGPVLPTLMRLATPNVLGLFANTIVIGFDGYIVGRLGADALADLLDVEAEPLDAVDGLNEVVELEADAGIDRVSSNFAVVAAETTALERLSVDLARQISVRLARYARAAKG